MFCEGFFEWAALSCAFRLNKKENRLNRADYQHPCNAQSFNNQYSIPRSATSSTSSILQSLCQPHGPQSTLTSHSTSRATHSLTSLLAARLSQTTLTARRRVGWGHAVSLPTLRVPSTGLISIILVCPLKVRSAIENMDAVLLRLCSTLFLHHGVNVNIDYSRGNYSERFFMQQGSDGTSFQDTGVQLLSLTITDNTFTHFNFLKDYATEGDSSGSRNQSMVAQTPILSNRNYGMLVDLAEGFAKSALLFTDNTVKDMLFYYKKAAKNPSNENEFKDVINHCEDFTATQPNYQFPLWDSESNRYAQFAHLISVKDHDDVKIVIADNTFNNISLPSSLIYLNETEFGQDSKVVLSGNTFSLILPYLGAGIMDLRKTLNQDPGFLQEQEQNIGNIDLNDKAYKALIKNGFKNLGLLGGNVLIQENTFSDIVGCPFVHTTLVHISILDSQGRYSSNTDIDDLKKFDRSPQDQTSTIQILDALYNTDNLVIGNLLREVLIQDSEYTIDVGSKSYTLNTLSTQFKFNKYSHLSLGVAASQPAMTKMHRGSLHKLNHVLMADFTGEEYTSIGTFTFEHLNYTMYKIKGETTYLAIKEGLKYNSADLLTSGINTFTKQSIFTTYLSTSLIDVYCSGRIRFVEHNIFTNVWLFSTDQMIVPSSGSDSVTETGVLIYTTYLFGSLQLGGSASSDGVAVGNIFVSNITGPFNRLNYEREPFIAWDPSLWSGTLIVEKDLVYGGSSPLVNIQDETNRPDNITVSNLQLRYIYTRATSKITNQVQFPLVISSVQDSSVPSATLSLGKLEIKNIYMSDVTYEGGNAFFSVYADEMLISNFTAFNIGGFYLNKESQYSKYDLTTFVNNSTSNIPLFDCYFYGATASTSPNNLSVAYLNVNQVGSNSGLPVFQVQQFIAPSVVQKNVIIISMSSFTNLYSEQVEASLMYDQTINGAQLDLHVKSSLFTKLKSINGIVASQGSLSNVTFEDCTFIKNEGVEVQLFSIVNNNFNTFIMDQCEIKGQYEDPSDVMKNVLREDAGIFASGVSLIRVTMSTGVYISNTIVSNIHYVRGATFLDISDHSKVILSNLRVSKLSAYLAGVFALSGFSTMTVSDSTFNENLAVKNGVFSVNDYSHITITGCTFKGNQAVYQGVFKVSGESFFSMVDTQFLENIAEKQNSIGQVNQVSIGSNFVGCTFSQNKAFYTKVSTGSKGLEILSCENLILFHDCTFKDNYAVQTTANIYINRGQQVVFNNTKFLYSIPRARGSQLKGSFLHLIAETSVTISHSNFLRGHAMYGGAIYILGDSSALISSSNFTENFAENKGGAICVESFASLSINGQSLFNNNDALMQSGDSIFLQNSLNFFEVKDSSFKMTKSSNFIFANDVSMIRLQTSNFKIPYGTTDARNKTSSIVVSDVKNLTIQNSLFENLIGQSILGGGAIQITESAQNKGSTNNISILGSTFKGCSNINGGALSLVDASHVLISEGTEFLSNTAAEAGGAIYFKCSNFGTDLNKCKLTITEAVFAYNTAEVEGGAIKWNIYKPKMINISMENNTAGVYGDNIASVAKKLIRIDESELGVDSFKDHPATIGRMLSTSSIENVQSGGQISIYFAIIDTYGSVIRTDFASKLFISPEHQSNSELTSLVETSSQVNCEGGNFKVENMIFVGEPSTTQRISFTTNAIDRSIPDNMVNAESHTQSSLPSIPETVALYDSDSGSDFVISLSLRKCIEGEQMMQNGKCQQCEAGTYLLEAPMKVTLCKECVDSAKGECLGGNLLYPKPGYWRSSKYSDNMIQCRNQEACLGRNPPENNTLGACGKGYQGILCTECEVGYSRSGSSYKCSKCPSSNLNVFRLVGLFVALVIGLVLLIRSNLQSAAKEKNYMTVFIRILMNHFHLLTLTASFDLEWPTELQAFFSSTKPISEVTTQFLSVDCFLDTRDPHLKPTSLIDQDASQVFGIFFQKLTILALFPLMVVVGSFVVWNIIFMCKNLKNQRAARNSGETQNDIKSKNDKERFEEEKNSTTKRALIPIRKDIENVMHSFLDKRVQELLTAQVQSKRKRGRIIATIIIILFLVHPTITSIMFNAFNCQNIDGALRLYEDLQVLCYTSSHKIFAYSLGLPSLILWGIGIPTYALVLVYKNRDRLTKTEIKEMYGFLYNGYRQPQAYFWEFIIMYRKILIIFIKIFLAQSGKIVQALSTLLLLILCLSATAVKQPFSNLPLNTLESISLMSSAVTVYCGLFYIADAQFKSDSDFSMSESSKMFLFSAIITSHVLFISYWIYHFAQEMRVNIRKRLPTIYLSLFLCCQQRKLDRELKIEEFRLRIAPFLVQFDKAMQYLEKRRQMYNNATVPVEDDQLRELVLRVARFASEVEKNLAFSGDKENNCVKIHDIVEKNQTRDSLRRSNRASKNKFDYAMKRVIIDPMPPISLSQNEQSDMLQLTDDEGQFNLGYVDNKEKVEPKQFTQKVAHHRKRNHAFGTGLPQISLDKTDTSLNQSEDFGFVNLTRQHRDHYSEKVAQSRPGENTTQLLSNKLDQGILEIGFIEEELAFQLDPEQESDELKIIQEGSESDKPDTRRDFLRNPFRSANLKLNSLPANIIIGETLKPKIMTVRQIQRVQAKHSREKQKQIFQSMTKGKISGSRQRKNLTMEGKLTARRRSLKNINEEDDNISLGSLSIEESLKILPLNSNSSDQQQQQQVL